MKHICPHCGKQTFSPIQKALCGGMSSAGKPCMGCGRRCVNGKTSLIVNSILRLIALGMIFYTYFTYTAYIQILYFGVIPLILAYVLGFLFDMFFGRLIPAIKRT